MSVRFAVSLVVALAALPAGALAPANILSAGGTSLLIIDADGNGPDPNDCIISGTFNDPNITLTKAQNNTPAIKGCSGGTTLASLFAGQDSSSDFLEVQVTSTSQPTGAAGAIPQLATLFRIPFTLDAYEEFPAGTPPDGFPAALNTVDFEKDDMDLATAYLCDAGGPSVVVDFLALASITIPLSFYPDATNPTHITIPNAPYELDPPNLGSFAFVDIHVPLQGGNVQVGIQGEPTLLVDIPLDALAPCRGVSAAPAVSTWAMILLAAGLLAIGVRRARRMRRVGA